MVEQLASMSINGYGILGKGHEGAGCLRFMGSVVGLRLHDLIAVLLQQTYGASNPQTLPP